MNTFLLVTLFMLWAGAVAFLRYSRSWLPFYVLGAVGCAYWLILVFSNLFGLEPFLAHSVAWVVHIVSNLVGIPTRIFEGAPGVLLVLVIFQEIGWTVLQVGIESSGLRRLAAALSEEARLRCPGIALHICPDSLKRDMNKTRSSPLRPWRQAAFNKTEASLRTPKHQGL